MGGLLRNLGIGEFPIRPVGLMRRSFLRRRDARDGAEEENKKVCQGAAHWHDDRFCRSKLRIEDKANHEAAERSLFPAPGAGISLPPALPAFAGLLLRGSRGETVTSG
jgi:hypothetical protein